MASICLIWQTQKTRSVADFLPPAGEFFFGAPPRPNRFPPVLRLMPNAPVD
jgi:hypothetical protein